MTTHTTTANGTYSDCGYGMPVALTITCGGTSCPALNTFPNLVCTSSATTTNCDNQVTCPQQPNFQSVFQLVQQDSTVTSSQSLEIDSQSFSGQDNGNGQVSYGPSPNPSSSILPPPSTFTPSVPSGTGTTVPTTTLIVQASNGRFSIPRPSNCRFILAFFLILSILVEQIQARSIYMRGSMSGALSTGSIILPLIWLLLPSGTYAQCVTQANIAVR